MVNETGKKRGNFRLIKVLLVVVIAAGIIILVYPFLPSLKYRLFPPEPRFPYVTKLNNSNLGIAGLPEQKTARPVPSDNRLVIPKIGVDVSIVEGKNENAALLAGAWHLPDTSSPDKGGNMVISGHRFRFRPPNNTTFYLLDKIMKDDLFIIYWQGKEYDYKVSETKIVNPNQVEILNNTAQAQVTLFTCTPLFTTRQRLVVIGQFLN